MIEINKTIKVSFKTGNYNYLFVLLKQHCVFFFCGKNGCFDLLCTNTLAFP